MIIVVLLIAISLLIALLFLGLYVWNLRSGQYDDLHTPSIRMLFDDPDSPGNSSGPEQG